MDDYEKKLKELRTYVPFLTKMIDKLEHAGDRSKEAQLAKMKSLKGILTATDKKLRLDTLMKCEDVLHKLYEKVEGAPVSSGSKSPEQSRRSSSPRREQGSISSYLQQLHDSQQHDPHGNRIPNRFQQNVRPPPQQQPPQGRPNPWMNNDDRGPLGQSDWPSQNRPDHGGPWAANQGPRHGFHRPPHFQDRPSPWGDNRGPPPQQNFHHPQRPPFQRFPQHEPQFDHQRFNNGPPNRPFFQDNRRGFHPEAPFRQDNFGGQPPQSHPDRRFDMNRPPDENRLRMEANRLMMEENRDRGGRFDMDFRPNENRLRMAANRLMMDENHPDPHRDRNRPIENRLRMEANRLMQEENRRFEENRDRGPMPFNDHRRFQPENRRSFSPQPRTESPNSSRNFVQEWNKGVRGPVSERPRSPGPVQEDLDTPASPEVKEDSPESPTMTSTPASPKATEEDTPASPVDTPMSPMDDTPASPPPQAEVKPVTNEAKMIPLERQNILKKVKSEKTESTQKQFDIRAPKDWHRGLRDRGPASSASPSSECSDDSDKVCQKRLQIGNVQFSFAS